MTIETKQNLRAPWRILPLGGNDHAGGVEQHAFAIVDTADKLVCETDDLDTARELSYFPEIYDMLLTLSKQKPAAVYVKLWDDTMEKCDCWKCEDTIEDAKELMQRLGGPDES